MKRFTTLFYRVMAMGLLLVGFTALSLAQSAAPTNVTLLAAPAPGPVSGVSASNLGNSGNNSYCWWVVPTYPIGDGPVNQTPACLNQINGPSAAATVRITWPAAPSATGYRVLRTLTPTLPNGVCTGCSITTTSTTTFTDTGAAGSNYIPGGTGGTTYSLALDNLSSAQPLVRTQLGNGSYILPNISGTPTTGNCVQFLTGGFLVDAGAPCGSGGGGGDVTGPAGATANNLVAFNGATGKVIKDSGAAIPTGGFAGLGQSNTFSTGTQDFSAVTAFLVKTAAGYAPTVSGQVGLNTTNGRLVFGSGGNARTAANQGASSTSGNCAQYDSNGALSATAAPCSTATAPTFSPPYISFGGNLYGPVFAMTDPSLPAYSWINQNTATLTSQNGAQILCSPSSGGPVSLNIRAITPPAPPYTLTVAMIVLTPIVSFPRAGLIFYESGTGKATSISSSTGSGVNIDTWTNVTTYSASPATLGLGNSTGLKWFRVTNTGSGASALSYSYSEDGYAWYAVYSSALNTFFTTGPDRVGFFTNSNGSTPVCTTVLSWLVT